jgi:hypothetical protein
MVGLRELARAVAVIIFYGLVLLGVGQALQAGDGEKLIYGGDHYGLWHSDEAKFTIDKVDDKGKFAGHVELLDGEYKGAKFDFTGEINNDGAIVLRRTDADRYRGPRAQKRPDSTRSGGEKPTLRIRKPSSFLSCGFARSREAGDAAS